MGDSIQNLLDRTLEHAHAAWDSVVPASLANLHDLPAHVHRSLDDLVDRLTLRQGLPDPRDWLPDALAPQPPAAPAPPTAPTTPAHSHSWLAAVGAHAAAHPLAYSLAALGLGTSASYCLAPVPTRRALERLVPLALLPDPKHRPLRLVPAQHGVAGEVRKEAVVVLGADSPHGTDLALDLERRGFVVVATVSDPAQVDVLEKLGRGWLKVLVLDPHESSSVGPFLRSLSTALSLRYPLHTAGDPFSRPAHALALTGVVNCLSLSSPPAAPYPLEATDADVVRKLVGEKVQTVVGAIKGLLPFLRAAAARPGAPTGMLVSLVPAPSTNLSIPFHSLTSAADAAISSLLHSLRRELSASTTSNVQLSILEVGFFQAPAAAPAPRATGPPLPIRLESVYAPALARRALPTDAGATAKASVKGARRATELRRLSRRVWQVLVRPTHAGAVERIGAGSRTYLFVSFLPHALVDLCLSVQDRLYAFYLSHLRLLRRAPSLSSSSSSSTSPTRSRPLPPHPHPPSLRPASSSPHAHPPHVPLADPFVPSPSPSASRASSSSAAAEDDSHSSSSSSLEDFGPLGASGTLSSASDEAAARSAMGGSYVEVGRDEGLGA
ncbi:uncharacterized protein JCM10292_002599 [Rhodotorula paludigena]|uniref:uncharacterized protein n=1 Tax=Rhodotorula paludigena TaxID=86838 RepID=UPI0031825C25